MKRFTGIGGAGGIAAAKVLKKAPAASRDDLLAVKDISNINEETARLNSALSRLLAEMNRVYEQKLGEGATEEAELYETYILILKDNSFFDDVRRYIAAMRLNAQTALDLALKNTQKLFLAVDDEYMRERFADIAAVCGAVSQVVGGVVDLLKTARLSAPTVIVADNLTPMHTMHLDKKFLAGFVLRDGGVTSHAVILAKTLGIPAVVGAGDAYENAVTGDDIIFSGDTGEIILRPTKKAREEFMEMYKLQSRLHDLFAAEPKGKTKTTDNRQISIAVNTGDRGSLGLISPDNCDGVGLYRTEFLYMEHNSYPSEERQLRAYREIATRMRGKEVIIRTLDIGGDKNLDYFDIPPEDNPFLGFRAIRVCLARPELFKTQITAILRASVHGNIKIMLPMIVSMEELLESLSIIEQCKLDLFHAKIPFNERIDVGMMIETPAAVFMAEHFAQKANFFSIGTNDLIQYITAVDRANRKVASLYDNANIAVLKAIRAVGGAALEAGIPLGVCGEMASADEMIPFLIGCGVSKLSVSAASVDRVRYIARRTSYSDARSLVEKVTECGEIAQARKLLTDFLPAIEI